jgi:TPR repeat protein
MTDSIAISIDRPANDILINNKEQALPIDEQEYTSPNPSTNASSINSEGSPGMNDSIPNNNSSNTSQSNYSSASLASSPSSTSSSNRQQQPAAVTYKYRTNPTAHITNLLSLDHSHLKPGQNASLLSYAQTINMYRENAKKTNNPDIQCELAKFIIDAATRKAEGEAQDEYLAEAEKLLKQLSIKGHADAQYELGKLFAAGLLHKKGRKPELEKAFALFVQASKHFHADAANRYDNFFLVFL